MQARLSYDRNRLDSIVYSIDLASGSNEKKVFSTFFFLLHVLQAKISAANLTTSHL